MIVLAWQALTSSAFAGKILQLGITVSGANIEIRALDDGSIKPQVPSASSIEKLHAIYFSLECFVNTECSLLRAPHEPDPRLIRPGDLVPSLKEEGERLLGPFGGLIDAADEVRFQIDWTLLKLPFDLLYIGDQPLFVKKKVSFTLGGVGGIRAATHWNPNRDWVGLLVSDETADPDRAIFGIEKDFPRSQSFDVADFNLSRLARMQPVDFVAISAHGHVDGKGNGYIAIANDQELHSDALQQLRPKLVYFDSCNLGVSASNLRDLRGSGTGYVIAPIWSNEAGDSSTATIEIFFPELLKSGDPVGALFRARSELFERYPTDDLRTRLWRSFPFRVYRLN